MFGSVWEHFANLRHVKRCKTCVSGLNALFRGTEFVKYSFYFIGTKMMFGSVSEHFANLRLVKRCKTSVSGLNTLFRGTKVVKHPFYFIGLKMMFGSVSEHFAKLRRVKDAKLEFGAWIHYFRVPSCKACILLHWTQNGVWECFRAFRQPSARKKMQNLCVGPECTILGYRSC
jgi:hypothetical protein